MASADNMEKYCWVILRGNYVEKSYYYNEFFRCLRMGKFL